MEKPEINLRPSDGHWVTDLWGIPYNGFRLELRDMYRALDGMLMKDHHVKDEELAIFFKWWKKFQTFVHEVQDIEDGVLRPWLVHKLGFSADIVDSHVHLLLQLNQIGTLEMRLGRVKPHELLRDLAPSCDDFARRLIIMCDKKEDILVADVRGRSKKSKKGYNIEQDKEAIEKEYWRAVLKSKACGLYLIAVAWMLKTEGPAHWWQKPVTGNLMNGRMIKLRSKIAALTVRSNIKKHKRLLKPLYPSKTTTDLEEEELLALHDVPDDDKDSEDNDVMSNEALNVAVASIVSA